MNKLGLNCAKLRASLGLPGFGLFYVLIFEVGLIFQTSLIFEDVFMFEMYQISSGGVLLQSWHPSHTLQLLL